jgi:putative transcriptional regulator
MPVSSLAPTLLIAMPQMLDPNFARSVVLLCRQEGDGALGLIVNRPTETLVSSVVAIENAPQQQSKMMVWIGGPVEPERGWLLLGFDPGSTDALAVGAGMYLSASADVLRALMESNEATEKHGRFLLGYAGWAGGQLESELAQSAWLTADVSRKLVFETPAEHMWEAAIRSLGINPFALQTGGGIH